MGGAIAMLLGAILLTVFFASPIIAIVGWIGFLVSDPQSGGWLAVAITFTVVGVFAVGFGIKKFSETKGVSALDMQLANSLPYEKRAAFLKQQSYKPVTEPVHRSRPDGIGATFTIKYSEQTGQTQGYFELDDGTPATEDVLEWAREVVGAMQQNYKLSH